MTSIAHRLRSRRRPIVRSWRDLAPLITGVVVFAVAASLVHRHRVAGAETDVFRAINDHTVVPFFVVWPIMQLGNFLVIPLAAVAALAARRLRLAVSLLVGGIAAYLIAADVVRRLVVRGRPATLLDDVHLRHAPAHGLGFVSGHVAVVTALAVIAWPYLGPRWRAVAVAAAVLVALARMYVGAHFPLDVLGGAGLGLAVAGSVRLVFGRPAANLTRPDSNLEPLDP